MLVHVERGPAEPLYDGLPLGELVVGVGLHQPGELGQCDGELGAGFGQRLALEPDRCGQQDIQGVLGEAVWWRAATGPPRLRPLPALGLTEAAVRREPPARAAGAFTRGECLLLRQSRHRHGARRQRRCCPARGVRQPLQALRG
ncbi:hypothetical protein AB0D45_00230 [Streptomyces sp. NPDC048352]|uniref:hypothetical protein n=1 Tax=Streptomyces sp. NPDC048352 TaxID=3154718 RepID=UPI0034170A2C